MKPSDYLSVEPFNSVTQKREAEIVFKNILKILDRTGNEWRQLPWSEYRQSRQDDGNFSYNEMMYFRQVADYAHPERIWLFSPAYRELKDGLAVEKTS